MAKDVQQVLLELRALYRFDGETGLFTSIRCPARRVGTVRRDGYIAINVAGAPRLAHRLAWLYAYGDWPLSFIDHMNGDRTDNRLSNLRDVPRQVNNENSAVPRSNRKHSKLVGAYLDTRRSKWFSLITCNKKPRFLGYFDSDLEASQAYMAAKRQLHPGFVG